MAITVITTILPEQQVRVEKRTRQIVITIPAEGVPFFEIEREVIARNVGTNAVVPYSDASRYPIAGTFATFAEKVPEHADLAGRIAAAIDLYDQRRDAE